MCQCDAGDSLALQLPLLGGEDSLHDWNYILSTLNLLPATSKVADVIRFLGTTLIILAGLGALTYGKRESRDEDLRF
jgi:hypothetical protein